MSKRRICNCIDNFLFPEKLTNSTICNVFYLYMLSICLCHVVVIQLFECYCS